MSTSPRRITKRTFPKFGPSVFVLDHKTEARIPLAEAPDYTEELRIVRVDDGAVLALVNRYNANGAPRYIVDAFVVGTRGLR